MGSLSYLIDSRPNLLFIIGFLCCFMENSTTKDLKRAKRILKYVKGTLELDLKYKQGEIFFLEGDSDSDYGGDGEERKSTFGFLFFLGGSIVTWVSQK